MESTVAKRGEQIFSLSFRRTDGRVKVIVKAHEVIEDLMRSWGSGERGAVIDFGGRNWVSPTPLEVWDLSPKMAQLLPYGEGYYTINEPGGELFLSDNGIRHGAAVNISFLRIVGVSEGVEFEVPGVHSLSFLKETQNRVNGAVKRLYTDFLLPVDLTLQINTQETRL